MSQILASGTVYLRPFEDKIQYNVNNGDWIDVIWPIMITNTAPEVSTLKIVFTEVITLSSDQDYFICNSNNIQFGDESLYSDSSRYIIDISSVSNYPGLINNGDATTAGYSNIRVYNLEVTSSESTLQESKGWIGQDYFASRANNCSILNCVSTGDMTAARSGGIVGASSSSKGGTLYILGCSSSGNQFGMGCGGIVGEGCAQDGGNLTIKYCHSTGLIHIQGGGIVGSYAGNGGTLTIDSCYSTGSIRGGGGIVGMGCSVGSSTSQCNILNCYSTGKIEDGPSGGIIADASGGGPSGSIIVTNCYSSGSIGENCGGIFGSPPSSYRQIFNCYTSGSSVTPGNGIFSDGSGTPVSCYSEANADASGWSDSNASLTMYSNTWISVDGVNTPYKLLHPLYTLYNLSIIDPLLSTFISDVGMSIIPGGSAPGPINVDKFESLKVVRIFPEESTITFDEISGVITTTTETPSGTYDVYIYAEKMDGSYIFNVVVLNVRGNRPPPGPPGPMPGPPPNAASAGKGSLNFTSSSYISILGALASEAGSIATQDEVSKKKALPRGGYGYGRHLERLKAKSALIPNTKKLD